jgi:hypothetical protein
MQAANDLSPASGDSAASSRQSLGNLSLNTFTPAGEDYVIFNLSNENKSKLLEASVEESKRARPTPKRRSAHFNKYARDYRKLSS